MLLKSLQLRNFRQFQDEKIIFSTDLDKNVTIIIGNNGTGKTTFFQAFFWCLYGVVEFKDKFLLNNKVVSNMLPGETQDVKVILSLIHSEIEYEITREQRYKMNSAGKLIAFNTTLNVWYKRDGQQEFLKQLEIEPRIKEILPKELSKYFFFDGERIEKLSKEIQSGKKSSEFSDAVKGLLGLSSLSAAINHLKPTKNGLIGNYENSYNSRSNADIKEYTEKIIKYENDLNKINQKLETNKKDVKIIEIRKKQLEQKINEYKDGEELLKEKNKNIKSRNDLIEFNDLIEKRTIEEFNLKSNLFFSGPMIKDAMNILKKCEFIDKDIPNIHSNTIKHLIEKKECLCGTPLEIGSKEYSNLIKLLEYLPPQSIGISVGQFSKECQFKLNNIPNLFALYSDNLKIIENNKDSIDEFNEKIGLLNKNLEGKKNIAPFQIELSKCEKTIREKNEENEELLKKHGAISTKMERNKTERKKLALLDESNKKIEQYKAYAWYMYDELRKYYAKKETEIRGELESEINSIFKDIYHGGMSLTIDDKYKIQVRVDEYNRFYNVETSTAQSISVIFAFITGIIKIARSSLNVDSENLLQAEPYPLVMDAPLSALDKNLIESVSKAIPSIAEQVIIFIKDTDGEIAKEHMKDIIGYEYKFNKLSEFETILG